MLPVAVPTVVASVDPYAVVAIGLGALALGFYLGIWLSARWFRRSGSGSGSGSGGGGTTANGGSRITGGSREGLLSSKGSGLDLSDDEQYFEVWDRLLEACYQSYRVQAVAGYDRGFFDTLHEPLLSQADEDDSPLLPGEIAFGEVRDVHHLREYWQRRRAVYFQATNGMNVEERMLYRRCLDDTTAALAQVGDHDKVYRLVVRTPGRQHVVLFPTSLREVLGIVPGPPGFDDPYF